MQDEGKLRAPAVLTGVGAQREAEGAGEEGLV
jgi:hypothetical protein